MINKYILLVVVSCIFVGCKKNQPIPKPYAYPRLEFPKPEYKSLEKNFPYSFEYSKFANIEKDNEYDSEPYWININYNTLNAKIYLSYKNIEKNFDKYREDAHKLAYKHYIKAEAINERSYSNKDNHVYGTIYQIKGNVASPIQFFVTDSTKHFLRGSLYFDTRPNKDSLSPAINFVHYDILHLIESVRWKK